MDHYAKFPYLPRHLGGLGALPSFGAFRTLPNAFYRWSGYAKYSSALLTALIREAESVSVQTDPSWLRLLPVVQVLIGHPDKAAKILAA